MTIPFRPEDLEELDRLRDAIEFEARTQGIPLTGEEIEEAARDELMLGFQEQQVTPQAPQYSGFEGVARGQQAGAQRGLQRFAGQVLTSPIVGGLIKGMDPIEQAGRRMLAKSESGEMNPQVPDLGRALGTASDAISTGGANLLAFMPSTAAVSKAPIVGGALRGVGNQLAKLASGPGGQAFARALPTEIGAAGLVNTLTSSNAEEAVARLNPVNDPYTALNFGLAVGSAGISAGLARGARAAAPGPDVPRPAEIVPDHFEPDIAADVGRREWEIGMGEGLTPGSRLSDLSDAEIAMRNEGIQRAFGIKPQPRRDIGMKGLAGAERQVAARQQRIADAADTRARTAPLLSEEGAISQMEAQLPPEMQTSAGTQPAPAASRATRARTVASEGAVAPATAPRGAFPGKVRDKFKGTPVQRVPLEKIDQLPPELQTSRGTLPEEPEPEFLRVRRPDGKGIELQPNPKFKGPKGNWVLESPSGTPEGTFASEAEALAAKKARGSKGIVYEKKGGAPAKGAGFRGKPKQKRSARPKRKGTAEE